MKDQNHKAIDLHNPRWLGRNARWLFWRKGLKGAPRHPPTRAAYVPVMRETLLLIAITVLAAYAGPDLEQATGISIFRQIRDMLALWFGQGIDPPSYYALEMWRPENALAAASYLTRFETKNGLFQVLNNSRPKRRAGNEMADKLLFADICREADVAHPQPLVVVTADGPQWRGAPAALAHDLFVKPRKGMGASGTFLFRYDPATDQHIGRDGTLYSRHQLLSFLQKKAVKPLLVQPRLANHPEIACLARESLLTVRVVTCLNEQDEPEVTMAMLRLLTKLEPAWKKIAPDGEYASPIDITSGRLGQMTGDGLRTSHLRYDHHPLTQEPLCGRLMPLWPDIKALALAAHRAVNHRAAVGWDIALTPTGPVVLEGNTNFDVMFLQRVHDAPMGATRLGGLLNRQLAQL